MKYKIIVFFSFGRYTKKMTYMREDEKKENAKTKQKYRAERCNGCDTKSKKQKKTN